MTPIGNKTTRNIKPGSEPPRVLKLAAFINSGNCGMLLNTPAVASNIISENATADIKTNSFESLLTFSFVWFITK